MRAIWRVLVFDTIKNLPQFDYPNNKLRFLWAKLVTPEIAKIAGSFEGPYFCDCRHPFFSLFVVVLSLCDGLFDLFIHI